MKKNLIICFLFLTVSTGFAQDKSLWNVQPNHELTLNYNLLGRSYAQGALYGAGGYALGMWVSNNRTHWGIVGSLVMVNLPIILENQLDQTEVVIGKNLGALTISAGFTIGIKFHRKGTATYNILPWLRKL